MKPTQLSVAMLMAFVAVVALDIAVARVLLAYCPPLMLGVCLAGPALQVVGFSMMFIRGRGRPFCCGFLLLGSLAMASFIWSIITGPNIGMARDPATGKVVKIRSPGSPIWTVWNSYTEAGAHLLEEKLRVEPSNPGITAALITAAPQILAALVGGMVARQISGRFGKGPDNGWTVHGGPFTVASEAQSSG